MKKPIILDTDFGGDPDDILALSYILHSPEVEVKALVTSDEYKKDKRAQVLKRWLNSKNIDIPLFVGKDLGNTNYFLLESFAPSTPYVFASVFESKNFQEILTEVASQNGQYVSIGGLHNVNQLYTKYKEIISKLSLVIMGGAIEYVHPDTAEHNIRLDIEAAKNIFNSDLQTQWFLSDYSFIPQFRLHLEHPLYLSVKNKPGFFFELIKENMRLFYTNLYPDSYLHDPVTLSSIFLPTIQFERKKMKFLENGEFRFAEKGIEKNVSIGVNSDLFLKDFYAKMDSLTK